ncbi:hypothetical protein L0Y49_03770, partial [bacterium]|nr:hypothetical protein [bacterium]
ERLKISTIFLAFLAAFSPRTMNSRYVNSFFTSSSCGSKSQKNSAFFFLARGSEIFFAIFKWRLFYSASGSNIFRYFKK